MRFPQRSYRAISLSLTACFVLVACADDNELDVDLDVPAPPGERLASALERDLAPEVSPEEIAALVEGNTSFALDAYRQIIEEADNVVYAPLSVSLALAMTYGGARGDTEAQLADALRYRLSQDRLHPAFNWLTLDLASRQRTAEETDGHPVRLDLINATFGQLGHDFLPSYLDLLALNYGAGMFLMDFLGSPEDQRAVINDWVAQRTADKIQGLLPPGTIDATTRLVLVNAVYFKASWARPFSPSIEPGLFAAPTGEVTVEQMSGGGGHRFTGEGYDAISLPYLGTDLDMVLIVPALDTLAALEASLDAELLGHIFSGLATGVYHEITMPRFEVRLAADLIPALMALGAHDPFGGAANFSGTDGTRDMLIRDIFHEAFVGVDEKGTEATGATAVVEGPPSVPPHFTIDRPFLFFIRDVPTGTVLFLGRILDPSTRPAR